MVHHGVGILQRSSKAQNVYVWFASGIKGKILTAKETWFWAYTKIPTWH